MKEGAQDVSWERNVFEALAGPSLENSPAKEFGLDSIKHDQHETWSNPVLTIFPSWLATDTWL